MSDVGGEVDPRYRVFDAQQDVPEFRRYFDELLHFAAGYLAVGRDDRPDVTDAAVNVAQIGRRVVSIVQQLHEPGVVVAPALTELLRGRVVDAPNLPVVLAQLPPRDVAFLAHLVDGVGQLLALDHFAAMSHDAVRRLQQAVPQRTQSLLLALEMPPVLHPLRKIGWVKRGELFLHGHRRID